MHQNIESLTHNRFLSNLPWIQSLASLHMACPQPLSLISSVNQIHVMLKSAHVTSEFSSVTVIKQKFPESDLHSCKPD